MGKRYDMNQSEVVDHDHGTTQRPGVVIQLLDCEVLVPSLAYT
jgi:hypothetical protein